MHYLFPLLSYFFGFLPVLEFEDLVAERPAASLNFEGDEFSLAFDHGLVVVLRTDGRGNLAAKYIWCFEEGGHLTYTIFIEEDSTYRLFEEILIALNAEIDLIGALTAEDFWNELEREDSTRLKHNLIAYAEELVTPARG